MRGFISLVWLPPWVFSCTFLIVPKVCVKRRVCRRHWVEIRDPQNLIPPPALAIISAIRLTPTPISPSLSWAFPVSLSLSNTHTHTLSLSFSLNTLSSPPIVRVELLWEKSVITLRKLRTLRRTPALRGYGNTRGPQPLSKWYFLTTRTGFPLMYHIQYFQTRPCNGLTRFLWWMPVVRAVLLPNVTRAHLSQRCLKRQQGYKENHKVSRDESHLGDFSSKSSEQCWHSIKVAA